LIDLSKNKNKNIDWDTFSTSFIRIIWIYWGITNKKRKNNNFKSSNN